MSKNRLPNFLLIGAGKSGTTSIHNYLDQHPEIYMSPVKEPNYFALMGQQKTTGYDEDDPDGYFHYPWAVTNWDDYQKLFDGVTNEKAIGEASTMYQYMPLVPERVKETLPGVKLIAIFRNPAERLYSRFMHLARENREPTPDFKDCLVKGNIWWKKNDLVQEGFYYSHMKRYFDLFEKENIKIFLYEDLIKDAPNLIKNMYNFLDVDESFEPNTSVQFNASGKIKNKFVDVLIGQNSILKKGVQKLSPGAVSKAKDSLWMQKTLNKMRKKNLSKPPMDISIKQELLKRVYGQEIEQFEQLIRRDLSAWKV